jgi:hypothetical protein
MAWPPSCDGKGRAACCAGPSVGRSIPCSACAGYASSRRTSRGRPRASWLACRSRCGWWIRPSWTRWLQPSHRSASTSGRRASSYRGDVLTVGFSGAALVHAGWISFSAPWIDEIGARLALGPTEACGYGAVTHPDWRGRGIQPAGALFRDEVMRSLGYTRHISWVWADNVANQRHAERGRRRTKTVWSIWVRGMSRPLVLGATVAGSPSLVRPS